MHAKRKRETKTYPQSEGNVALADERLRVFQQPKAKTLSLCWAWHRTVRRRLPKLTPWLPQRELWQELGYLSCCGVSSFSSCTGFVYTSNNLGSSRPLASSTTVGMAEEEIDRLLHL